MSLKHKKSKITKPATDSKKIDTSVQILNVSINGTRIDRVLKKIWLQRKEMLHVATVNPEFVMEARTNDAFAKVLSNCLTVADGWGVVWANKLLNSQASNSYAGELERITGTQLSNMIVEHASQKGEKVFLLGGADGVAELAAKKLSKIYPQLQISWYSGAQTVRLEKNEEASMTIAKINAYEPDYLLVAYGSPWQDMWIEDNRKYLRVRVAIGVGGTLDEWAGVVALCPDWLDRIGLKWLYRLVIQPWRWRRIIEVLKFGWLVVWQMNNKVRKTQINGKS